MYDWHTKSHTGERLAPAIPARRQPAGGARATRPPTWADAWGARPPPGLIGAPASTTTHHTYHFTAAIRRPQPVVSYDDRMGETQPPAEPTPESETKPEESAVAPDTGAPKEGETMRLPDIVPGDDGAYTIEQTDPVMPTLSYEAHIHEQKEANKCPVADDGHGLFGLTTCRLPSVIHISVTPVLGWYFVDATLDETIIVQVCDGVGPLGQVDITSENDPYITKENYLQVVQNLTPNAGGVPLREVFYARDISLIHENFHARDWATTAKASMPDVEKWLRGKWAGSVFSVNGLLVDMSKQFMKIVLAKYAHTPADPEVRAYGDGKALYQKRAAAITAKGDAGKYPPWDWKKGLP